jgi:hypothetical protein
MAVFTGTVYRQENIRSLSTSELEYIIANETDAAGDTPPHFNVALATAELARRGVSGAGYVYDLAPGAYPPGFSGFGDSGFSGFTGQSVSGFTGASGESGFSGYSGYGP